MTLRGVTPDLAFTVCSPSPGRPGFAARLRLLSSVPTARDISALRITARPTNLRRASPATGRQWPLFPADGIIGASIHRPRDDAHLLDELLLLLDELCTQGREARGFFAREREHADDAHKPRASRFG